MTYPTRAGLALAASLFAFSACAPAATAPTPAPLGLPAIPAADGALEIRVVHPTATTPAPRADSVYIYGSVGTGRASLTIDGTPVPVRPNGAFLAFLPIPADASFDLVAGAGGRTATLTRAYRPPPPPPAPGTPVPAPAPRPAVEEISPARTGTVTGGTDTLATGSDVAIGRPTPTGTYRWFLPRGARVAVTGRLGDMLRVRLDTATAWIPAGEVALAAEAPADSASRPAPAVGAPTIAAAPGWVDVRVGAGHAPFHVEADSAAIRLTLYGRTPPAAGSIAGDPLIEGIGWSAAGPRSAVADIRLGRRVWGYKAFYEPNGDLVIRVRRPPEISAEQPLRGLRIVVDPGHPPGGATGPTGLTEAEANLAIGLRLAEMLRARGADVILTRVDGSPVSLTDRIDLAVDRDAHLLVSVHNNAFGEGVNPFVNNGTSTYYFHPFSAALARALDREIASATRIADLGAKASNLALVRPTWMPSTLTESLFMLIPEQEAALRNPDFLDRLAAAHVRGIESFLRGR